MTDQKIKDLAMGIWTAEENKALLLALTIVNILEKKKICTADEFNENKEAILDKLVTKTLSQYDSDPKMKESLDGMALINKFFTIKK